MGKTFLIIGGYGNTGSFIAELLLKHTDSKIILAGRSLSKAEKTSQLLNTKFFDERVKAVRIDINAAETLPEKFSEADMVINAANNNSNFSDVANSILQAGKDYFGIQISSEKKYKTLTEISDLAEDKNLFFITDGGMTPGIPAALIRYSSRYFDKLESANVAGMIKLNWNDIEFSQSKKDEIVEEILSYKQLAYHNNNWIKPKPKYYKRFDFDNETRNVVAAPFMLEELRNLPGEFPFLHETGFYIAGYNPYVNYFMIPAAKKLLRYSPSFTKNAFGNSIVWGLKKLTRPPFISTILLSAVGRKDNLTKEVRIKISHHNGYWLTAASVTAVLFQYLRNNFTKPGLHFQGHLVNPLAFLKDLEQLGASVSIYT